MYYTKTQDAKIKN